MKDKISIIIPVYNAEATLKRCLDSILAQTYNKYEIILINDGSKDNSLSICEEYTAKYKFINVYSQKNSGPSAARNSGLLKAKGDYICFIDSDDEILENYLELLLKNKADLVMCGYTMIKNNNTQDIKLAENIEVYKEQEILNKMIDISEFDHFNQLWNKLYRKNIIVDNDIRFDENIDMGEDFLFNIEYIKLCNQIKIIEPCLYLYYVLNSASLTSKFKEKRWNTELYIFKKYLELFKHQKLTKKQIAQNNAKIISYVSKTITTLMYSNYKIQYKINYIKSIFNDKYLKKMLKNTKPHKKSNIILKWLIKFKLSRLTYLIYLVKKKN